MARFNHLTVSPNVSNPARMSQNTSSNSSPVERDAVRREELANKLVEEIDELNWRMGMIDIGLRLLDDKSEALLVAMYVDGLTMQKACQRIGITQDTAKRIHGRALDKMATLTGIHDMITDD